MEGLCPGAIRRSWKHHNRCWFGRVYPLSCKHHLSFCGHSCYVSKRCDAWSSRSRFESEGSLWTAHRGCFDSRKCPLTLISSELTKVSKPIVPAAHTQVAAYVVGERAAHLVRSFWNFWITFVLEYASADRHPDTKKVTIEAPGL